MVSSVNLTDGAAARPRYGGTSLALAILCAVLFLTFLDNTIVSVVLGNVQTSLQAGVSDLQWVVGAYALTFAGAMLAFGMVGDEFGRKKVMIIGVAIFCAGSLLSALAPNPGVLIAGRAVMGFGAAASEPGTLSMIRHIYTDERPRAQALGVWTAVSGLALALGPVVGGALVGIWDWRAIFWFNVVFGLLALAGTALVLPENSDPEAHRVDVAGTLLGAAAITALAFAVILAESSGFASAPVIALLCVFVAAVGGFVWWQFRAAHPLLDPRFLRVPRFFTANVVAFCAYFATFAVFFFTALYLEEVVSDSGYQIALIFLPMTVFMTLACVLAGRWTTVVGTQWSILAGCLLFGCGLLLTSLTLSSHPAYLPLAASLALAGIGIGSTVVPATAAGLSAVPAERSGMAASAVNTSREIGAVTGVAVLGALVSSQLASDLTAKLIRLGVPPVDRALVIKLLETGVYGSLANSTTGSAAYRHEVAEVTSAAYSAFYNGLHDALFLSAIVVFGAGVVSFMALGGWREVRRAARAGPVEPAPGAD